MRSVMKHRFSEVPSVEIPRSTFDRSHGYKTSFDAGKLIPFFIDEALPGDTFSCNVSGFARLSTPTYPIMDNMVMDTFFFSVPIRQLWSNFRKFMGEQVDPGDSIDYTIPIIDDVNNASNESIYDYCGIPTQVAADLEVNALPFRAIYHIWNEWFRDQNLQDSLDWSTDDGPDAMADYTLQSRTKRHDYFTSCLPWLQKGDAVQLSLGDTAPIFGDNMDFDDVADSGNMAQVLDSQGGSLKRLRTGSSHLHGDTSASGSGQLLTDLSAATAGTINELRQAFQVQKLLEKDARAGSRYPEIVSSHFGVTFPDLSYRPEYLGGGSTPVNINPVADTATNIGQLGAFGTVGFTDHGFVKSFTEHCYIIGFVNVRADLTYQEGLDRMWSRSTRYDFYWPVLSHLGEQAVLNKEIYVDAADIASGAIDDVFGYQERYAEYRYKPSKITGKLRSNDAASLDAWHLGIEFGATPTLDDTFIVDNPPLDRCIQTASEPHFIFDSYIRLQCTRPMPVYSVPGYVDHF
jgi:hypothetical protein